MSRIAMAVLVCASLHAALLADERPDALGIVDVQPSAGRFVPIDGRFMVPYEATIPGTKITYEMIPVPAGRFVMGSPADEPDRRRDEGPQVPVRVGAFWMGKCEVTWGEYKQYMAIFNAFRQFKELKIRRVTRERELDAVTAPSIIYEPETVFEHGEDPRLPAAAMTQFAAKQYTHWLSGITGRFYRLPTEAEWEYACRAGSKSAFHYGDAAERLSMYGWFDANSDARTHRVGLKRPNAWGLHDMHGNVREWVLDEYSADGYLKLEMGGDAAEVLRWPRKRFGRVVRGGSWDDAHGKCRSAARGFSKEDWWEFDPELPQSSWWLAGSEMTTVGFRIFRPWTVPEREGQNRYWDADEEELRDNVEESVQFWRGGRGLVDRDLPKAMQQLKNSAP